MTVSVWRRRRTARRAASRAALLALAAALLAAPGCSKKKSAGEEEDLSGGMGDSEFAGGSDYDVSSEGSMAEPERVRELGSVYFDYDSASIRSDARATLKSNAQVIQDRSEWRTVTLEGHTDERGTEEYNLALGERRANAVKQYLVDLGVPSGRMFVVSFGEGSPAVQGHDESAWRWNRRVEFKVARQ